jgi:hypothetical protein
VVNKTSDSRSVSLPVVIVVALLPVLGGLIWYASKRASEPAPVQGVASADAKAYVQHLKLSGVEMKATANFAGAAVVEIVGNISNNGDRSISRVELSCIFYDVSGLVVLKERVPIVRSPLAPGETKPFRLPFEGVPQSWNQTLPSLVIAQIVFG